VKELASKPVGFAKFLVERKITVLIVHNDRVPVASEMEANLMHPAGGDSGSNESSFRESPHDPKTSESVNRFALPAREPEIYRPFVLLKPPRQQTEILFSHPPIGK
jgi:hypothetical protein